MRLSSIKSCLTSVTYFLTCTWLFQTHMSGLGSSSSHQITLPRPSSSNIDVSLCCQPGTFCLQLPRQDFSWARIKSSCLWRLGDRCLWMQFLCPWLVLFPVSLVVLGVGRTLGSLRLPRQGPVIVSFSLFRSPVLGLCVCRRPLQSLQVCTEPWVVSTKKCLFQSWVGADLPLALLDRGLWVLSGKMEITRSEHVSKDTCGNHTAPTKRGFQTGAPRPSQASPEKYPRHGSCAIVVRPSRGGHACGPGYIRTWADEALRRAVSGSLPVPATGLPAVASCPPATALVF